MSYVDVGTVFMFMVLIIGGAGYGAYLYAEWQNRETTREIEAKFREFRNHMKGVNRC